MPGAGRMGRETGMPMHCGGCKWAAAVDAVWRVLLDQEQNGEVPYNSVFTLEK